MFWKVSSFSSGSAVEGILDKQKELLDEDELVQVLSVSSQKCSLKACVCSIQRT